jgi:MHS family proline/betaine transporter-like MFS transporter
VQESYLSTAYSAGRYGANARALAAASIGNMLEWYDFAIYAFSATILARHFFPRSDETASLLATFATFGVGFVVRPLGALVIGRLGDVRGRKAALLTSMFLMAIGTVGIGLLPDQPAIGAWAPALLVCCRALQGFSAGAQWTSATIFVVEWAPRGHRGYFGSFQQVSVTAGFLLGSVLAALLSTFLSPAQMDQWGWRALFIAGGLLIPVGLYVRRFVDEPPPAQASAATPPPARRWGNPLLALKAGGFTVLWTAAYYAILSYLPTFFTRYGGLSAAHALWLNALGMVVLMLSTPLFGAWSDRIGRRPLLLGSCLAFALLSYPLFFLMVAGYGWAAMVAFGLMIAAFNGPGPASIAELFQRNSRSTWMAIGYSLSVALFGGFAPYIATWLIRATGSPLSPTYYLSVAAIISGLVIFGMRETAQDELH